MMNYWRTLSIVKIKGKLSKYLPYKQKYEEPVGIIVNRRSGKLSKKFRYGI
jgi:hypothetical protein